MFENKDYKILKDYEYNRQYYKEALNTIEQLLEPVISCYSFKRLGKATFLGALSSKFDFIDYEIIKTNKNTKGVTHLNDQSRLEHSIIVAYLAYTTACTLNFNKRNCLYAAIWGLLHDIATWPLSHTGEAAFTKITKISSRNLREILIADNNELPEKYKLNTIIKKLNLSCQTILNLFDKQESKELDAELHTFWHIVHSPLTPDTIDGIWRSGKNYGMNDIPKPFLFTDIYEYDLIHDLFVKQKFVDLLVNFWEKKAELYREFINKEKVVEWESDCSNAILQKYNGIDLVTSLELNEEELVDVIKKSGVNNKIILRYKAPDKYYVNRVILEKKIKNNLNVDCLSNIFKKETR